MYDFWMQWFFEFVTLIAEKSHIAMSEGVVPMPAMAVLLSTSTITACVVVEKFPKISFDKLAEVWLDMLTLDADEMLNENSSRYCRSSSLSWNEGFIWKENIELNLGLGKTFAPKKILFQIYLHLQISRPTSFVTFDLKSTMRTMPAAESVSVMFLRIFSVHKWSTLGR